LVDIGKVADDSHDSRLFFWSVRDASQALGIAPGSFSRLCRQYEIETPRSRRRRRGHHARGVGMD